jgi:hypothetical protein
MIKHISGGCLAHSTELFDNRLAFNKNKSIFQQLPQPRNTLLSSLKLMINLRDKKQLWKSQNWNVLDSVFAPGGSHFLDAITECSSQLSGFRPSLWKQAGTTPNNIFKLITNRFYSTFSIDTCCDAIVLSVIPNLYNSTSGYTGIPSSQIAVVMPDPLFTSSGRSLQAEMTSVPLCLPSKQGGLAR